MDYQTMILGKLNNRFLDCILTCLFNRDILQKALALYTKQTSDEVVAEANCSLAYLCMEMGDWSLGKHYLKEAEKLLPPDEVKVESYVCICMYNKYSNFGWVLKFTWFHHKYTPPKFCSIYHKWM